MCGYQRPNYFAILVPEMGLLLLLLLLSLCLSRFSIFPREQIAPSNLRSLGLALQSLKFQEMLLFAKTLCCSLPLTSPASLSIFFDVTPSAPITAGITTI